MRSLRRRLFLVLSGSILAAWLATAFFSWLDARRLIREMLDGGLAEAVPHEAIAERVAAHLMHPLWIAVPVLAVVIWLSVGWGLAPLRLLAEQLGRRDPGNLAPLDPPGTPEEVRPLVAALNGLFARVDALLARERRFSADAAHELRTPLAAIRTHAQVAAAARDEAERAAALAGVVAGADRATHLVEQLLTLARLEAEDAPPAAPVALAPLAAGVVAQYAAAAAAKGVDLGIARADAAVVPGGEALLAVLLRNLVDNAVRYTPPGGRIDVLVRQTAAAAEIVVADDGPGMAPAERERAFERFHRVLGSGAEGSGLGLSIVQRVAELHRGRVALAAGPGGRGLAVVVTLPLAA